MIRTFITYSNKRSSQQNFLTVTLFDTHSLEHGQNHYICIFISNFAPA